MPKHKSNRNKYLLIVVLLLIVAIVLAVAVTQTNSKKPLASQYFIVTHTVSAGEFSTTDNETVVLTTLGLNITAVGGDATAVQVRVSSQANPIDDYLDSLPKGPPGWDMSITLVGGTMNFRGLQRSLNSQGMFKVDVTISCNEATRAVIPVLINPNDVIPVPLT